MCLFRYIFIYFCVLCISIYLYIVRTIYPFIYVTMYVCMYVCMYVSINCIWVFIFSGLGPEFRLRLQLTNAGTKSVSNVSITFNYNPSLYTLRQPCVHIPLLVPSLSYEAETELYCIDPSGAAGSIKVFVVGPNSAVPYITALVQMPLSELPLEGDA